MALTLSKMNQEPTPVYAYLNIKIGPIERGEDFEDPLDEALEANKFGEVTGGGTMQEKTGEISFCGIDIDLFDLKNGIEFVTKFLESKGAPKGSKLEVILDEETRKEYPFGVLEGVGVYVNATDLPDEIYEKCDINFVWDEIDRLLGEEGKIKNHWQGPTETALYIYGKNRTVMEGLIRPLLDTYPLLEKSRVETIA